MIRVAILGGALTLDRAAGWNLMLSQPLVGACFAGILLSPVPSGSSGHSASRSESARCSSSSSPMRRSRRQRQHDTATAGVVGTTVAILGMARLHEAATVALGGALWVVIASPSGSSPLLPAAG